MDKLTVGQRIVVYEVEDKTNPDHCFKIGSHIIGGNHEMSEEHLVLRGIYLDTHFIWQTLKKTQVKPIGTFIVKSLKGGNNE